MAIAVSCPCGKHFGAHEEDAGKEAKCPACGRVLVIGGVEAVPAPAEPTARKICVVCGEDCSASPRTRDAQGRYYHDACYEQARSR